MAAASDRTAAPSTLAERIAGDLHAFDESRLTPALIDKAKLCVLDFLACALEARDRPWSVQAIAAASGGSGLSRDSAGSAAAPQRLATILGTPYVVGSADAAFANAVLGHGLVRDDMHLGSVSHLGCVVLPALLARAESERVSGRHLLTAIVVGYEAGGKLGRAVLDVEVARIFRPTGITGPFAAAAGVAKLLGLDAPRFAVALELAANLAAGYNEWATTGGSEMFFHPGFAARNALMAVDLAAAGAYASPTALEGNAGLLAAFGKRESPNSRDWQPLPQEAAPGAMPFSGRAEILEAFFKEVPACNFAQTAAQAAREIATRDAPPAESMTRVGVRVPYAAARYPGCDYAGPFTQVLQAKMSIHYNVAAALCTGNFDERNYEPARQPEIARVARLVSLEVDDALTRAFPAKQGAAVDVELNDGRRLSARRESVTPASDELVRARFALAANEVLGIQACRAALAFIDGLEAEADAGALARLVRVAKPK
ncbi:MAG TPA: MmgE/PrpD family protein [Gammaproteobacteria bacterium]